MLAIPDAKGHIFCPTSSNFANFGKLTPAAENVFQNPIWVLGMTVLMLLRVSLWLDYSPTSLEAV